MRPRSVGDGDAHLHGLHRLAQHPQVHAAAGALRGRLGQRLLHGGRAVALRHQQPGEAGQRHQQVHLLRRPRARAARPPRTARPPPGRPRGGTGSPRSPPRPATRPGCGARRGARGRRCSTSGSPLLTATPHSERASGASRRRRHASPGSPAENGRSVPTREMTETGTCSSRAANDASRSKPASGVSVPSAGTAGMSGSITGRTRDAGGQPRPLPRHGKCRGATGKRKVRSEL